MKRKDQKKWGEIRRAIKSKKMVTVRDLDGLFTLKKIQSNGLVKLDNSIYVDYRLIEVTRLSNKIGIFDNPD